MQSDLPQGKIDVMTVGKGADDPKLGGYAGQRNDELKNHDEKENCIAIFVRKDLGKNQEILKRALNEMSWSSLVEHSDFFANACISTMTV